MIFGPCPLDDAEGAVLAHRLKVGDLTLKKGHLLSLSDINLLRSSGHTSLTVARPERNDVDENKAALTIATMVQGNGLEIRQPFTGRCNLYAKTAGLLIYESEQLDALNLIDESITIAALPNYAPVSPGQLVVTVKIIPFFVPEFLLKSCLSHSSSSLFHIASFQKKTAALIQTELPGIKESVYLKTASTMQKRIESLGSTLAIKRRCSHVSTDIAATLLQVLSQNCDLIMISGASAIIDRRDVIPTAILEAGGSITHFGMPVDPGNLLLLAFSKDKVPILGLPGCARSAKTNGLDWVLQRLHAEIPLSAKDIQRMGSGGLLAETERDDRPLPRNPEPKSRQIAAVVLAAGLSSRMKGMNKLLEKIDGTPIIVRTLSNILHSKVTSITVVVGNDSDSIRKTLLEAGLTDIHIVASPNYTSGLSQSLISGLNALPPEIEGALVCLADMPFMPPADIDRLIAAFNPAENNLVVTPVHNGRRGNPVLWGKRFFPRIQKLTGDKGARQILGEVEDFIVDVEISHDGIFIDIDNPDDLSRSRKNLSLIS